MSYTEQDIEQLKEFYQHQLLDDTVPFWFPRSIDEEYGGYLLMRGRDGSLLDDDKAVWIQGRAAWLLSTLYNTIEPKQEWLDGAKKGIDFLNEHCFDTDGRMFFHVTRDGSPIRKRRYYFSETFAVIAMAAYVMRPLPGKQDTCLASVLSTPQYQVCWNPNLNQPARPKA